MLYPKFQQKIHNLPLGTSCKSLAITSGFVFFLFLAFFNVHPHGRSSDSLAPPEKLDAATSATTINHIVFGIVGSMNTWSQKRAYLESWWRPNATRGYLFLDRAPPEGWRPWWPPFRVSENASNLPVYSKFVKPSVIRIARTILEMVRLGEEGVRWYVMADDDTVFFVDNLVEVLEGYDHREYFYVGANSECIMSNVIFSFDMGFGGAGYALSYPLAQALASNIDACLERYPFSYVSDFLISSCIADLGVSLTHHNGFHQIDLHGDISGLLSAHLQAPLLSLHHFDTVDPIFPSKNRSESVNHLMEAAKADPSRLLQQSICYHRPSNWSISVAWGYSAHIYEHVHPRSFLHRPLETFQPWLSAKPPLYLFNTRWPSNDPCTAPHLFYFESVDNKTRVGTGTGTIVTMYGRAAPRGLAACLSSGNHSADPITRITVYSPSTPLRKGGRNRVECCDFKYKEGNNLAVKLRDCFKDEMVA